MNEASTYSTRCWTVPAPMQRVPIRCSVNDNGQIPPDLTSWKPAQNLVLSRFWAGFQLVGNLLKTSRRQVANNLESKTCFRQVGSISTCRDRSSRFSTSFQLFCVEKQVLSRIEAVEFRNDNDQTRPDFFTRNYWNDVTVTSYTHVNNKNGRQGIAGTE